MAIEDEVRLFHFIALIGASGKKRCFTRDAELIGLSLSQSPSYAYILEA